MTHLSNRKRMLIPIFLLLLALGAWYLVGYSRAAENGTLGASGTVEARQIVISAELSGRVVEVMVQKGQSVKAGDPLLRLDDALLRSQQRRAEAAIAAAEANRQAADSGLAAAQAALASAEAALETANLNAAAERLAVQKSLDDLYETAAAARAEAARNVAQANRNVRNAIYMLDNFTVPTAQKNLTASEGVSLTKQTLDAARIAFEPYRNEDSGNDRREELKDALDQAQSDYDAAVRRMELETAVDAAQAQLDQAMQDLHTLADGPDPKNVAVLDARLAAINAAPLLAETAVEQARTGVKQAEDRQKTAQAAVDQAKAELDLLIVQIEKLTVSAPEDGVVIERDIEPGEVIQAGAALLTIGRLDRLTITVYLPEDRYGAIQVGQTARVSVDSFPGQEFFAAVTHIADRAEFTPRNVQTAEGRRTTVFAIELEIDNAEGKLKPGMPADVEF